MRNKSIIARLCSIILFGLIISFCFPGTIHAEETVKIGSPTNLYHIECGNCGEAGRQLRAAMQRRATHVLVYVDFDGDSKQMFTELLNSACYDSKYKHDDDLLRVKIAGYHYGYKPTLEFENEFLYYEYYDIYFKWFDSKEKAEYVSARVNSILRGMNLKNCSEIEKFDKIYSYVTRHVTYDDTVGKAGDMYTAYGALRNGKAVCQGFADLLCVMLKTAGVDCRLVQGNRKDPANNGGHIWAVVRINNLWYYTDPTDDSTLYHAGYPYASRLKASMPDRVINMNPQTLDPNNVDMLKRCKIASHDYIDKKQVSKKTASKKTASKKTGTSVKKTKKVVKRRAKILKKKKGKKKNKKSAKKYKLTVVNGKGDGYYRKNKIVKIKAAKLPGKKFVKWSGKAVFVKKTTKKKRTAYIKIKRATKLRAVYKTAVKKTKKTAKKNRKKNK